MDPFTIALATFGVQKLRGKSTKRALRDAAIVGGGSYALGSAGNIAAFQGPQGSMAPFSSLRGLLGMEGAASKEVQAAIDAGNVPANKVGIMAPKEASKFADIADGITDYSDEDFIPRIMKGDPGKGSAIEGFTTVDEALPGQSRGDVLSAAMDDKSIYKVDEDVKTKGILGNLKDKYDSLTGTQKFVGAAVGIPLVTSLLEGDPEFEPPFTEEDYKKAYAKAIKQIEGGFEPVKQRAMSIDDAYGDREIYNYNQGGLASIKKFNEGGINYLPSKVDHNEKDATNYVRATGYVEDGSGTGDKDEDTMLAQLADGEFVSRADAVLGAGILSGGDPKSYKNMRKKGAEFFYDQQKKFKRIFDLINASKTNQNS
tara:strand:- start:2305 stop:3417 length:1113 start_codon:yes stop_codon:yes gene_type:complete